MPDGSQRERPDARSDAARRADHAGISKLAEDLLPALIAKLGSTGLGELEVREGDWQVRLRRPFGSGPGEGRRASDKPSRSQPGHEGHGHGRAGVESHRGAKDTSGSNGTGGSRGGADAADKTRTIATSPAVGIFQPGSRAASGTKIRAGDSLGTVNVIGVPQDILAPADGIVGSTLVEAGTAVEYGQELIRIELAAPAAPGANAEAR
ncbi:MAG TPA: biotin/lipoyl-containing protein [Candidatus Limnocylindria bacterium]|nr:biotin/lipoyl-containing protein [Candidatus Limnocylindria bacterium]